MAASGRGLPMPFIMGPNSVEACSHQPAGQGSGLAVHLSGRDWHPEGQMQNETRTLQVAKRCFIP